MAFSTLFLDASSSNDTMDGIKDMVSDLSQTIGVDLFEEDIDIANWGRKLAELEFLRAEEKLIPLLFTTASERYRVLLERTPDLLQRIPLECLASYLGITPVSLSRIRAKLK